MRTISNIMNCLADYKEHIWTGGSED